MRALLLIAGRVDARLSNRRARLRDAFWTGVLRGVGAMIGFAVAGAALVFLLRYVAERNLPVISDFLAEVVYLVQLRMR